MNEDLNIDGPAGSLQARLTGSERKKIAVLCHPHPRYGGSMDDGVLGVLAEALEARGISALRFNFRGVGASGGQYDGDGGETDDLRAVIAWMRQTYPEAGLVLGGYSFGAGTVCNLLAEDDPPALERILLIAPPLGNLPVPEPDGRTPTDVIVGDADPFVDPSELAQWTAVQIHRLPGADHFFAGHWQSLAETLAAVLDRS
jgi:alpha/beta superfamily hydrolase